MYEQTILIRAGTLQYPLAKAQMYDCMTGIERARFLDAD